MLQLTVLEASFGSLFGPVRVILCFVITVMYSDVPMGMFPVIHFH